MDIDRLTDFGFGNLIEKWVEPKIFGFTKIGGEGMEKSTCISQFNPFTQLSFPEKRKKDSVN